MPHLVANRPSIKELRRKQVIHQTPRSLIPITCRAMVRLERQAFPVFGVLRRFVGVESDVA